MGCLYQMLQQNQIVCFSLVYFCDLFLKFLALLVIGNEILIHVPVLCK